MHCNRNYISEGIDLAESSGSKGYMVYYYKFFNHGFKYQDSVCNDYHDLLMQCVNFSNVAIISVKRVGYRGIHVISKSDAILYLKNI